MGENAHRLIVIIIIIFIFFVIKANEIKKAKRNARKKTKTIYNKVGYNLL